MTDYPNVVNLYFTKNLPYDKREAIVATYPDDVQGCDYIRKDLVQQMIKGLRMASTASSMAHHTRRRIMEITDEFLMETLKATPK